MIFLRLLEPIGNDFVVYYEAAKMFLAGQSPYQGLLTRTFPFNYPPPALLFLFPLAFFDYDLANVLWNLLSTLSVVASIWLILRLTSIHSVAVFVVISFLFTVPFFPVKFNIGNAQINHFLLLFCSLALYLYHRGRKSFAAVFFATAIAVKLAPVIFLLYFAIRRDWQQIIRVAVFLIFLAAVSLIFVPASYQLVYVLKVLPLSFTAGAKDWYYNQSLWGYLARAVPTIATYLFFPLALVILFLTWWRGRILSWRRALAAVSCLYLLIHPIALQHYFGFAIIPLILLLSRRDWFILAVTYLLLGLDIKNFEVVPKEFSFILSHDFFAILMLWILALWPEKFWQIIKTLWISLILLSYALFLACRRGAC